MLSRASHAVVAALFAASGALAGTPATCTDPEISCQSTTFVSNLCCFNAPGGQLLLTEFWDTSPPTGKTQLLPHKFLATINRTEHRPRNIVDNS